MVYDGCKIYGPYKGKDERLRIFVIFPNGKKCTRSYPKYLVEIYLNRYLTEEETVDHIDSNFKNNDISNLRVLSRVEHAALDVKRIVQQEFICPWCGDSFILAGLKLHCAIHNRRKGKSGPFCSRSCVGKYGAELQNNRCSKLAINIITPEYTTNKKLNK